MFLWTWASATGVLGRRRRQTAPDPATVVPAKDSAKRIKENKLKLLGVLENHHGFSRIRTYSDGDLDLDNVEMGLLNVIGSPESRVRLPNDLILTIVGLKEDEDDDGSKQKHKEYSLESVVPKLINVRCDTNIGHMVPNYKFGFEVDKTANGKVLIPLTCLKTGTTEVVELKNNKTILVDRPIKLYSWVKQGKHIGFITDIKSLVDLEINESGLVIKNVSEEELKIVPEIYVGQYVVYKSWIGCVQSTVYKLHIKFSKGAECYLRIDPKNEERGRRLLHLKYPGESFSLTGADIKSAEWIKRPGLTDWVRLRYLNTGYSDWSYGEILKNEISQIFVSWLRPCNDKNASPFGKWIPPSQIFGNEIELLQPLSLPNRNRIWHGVKGKYTINHVDKFMRLEDEWVQDLLYEYGINSSKGKGNENVSRSGGGDAPLAAVSRDMVISKLGKVKKYTTGTEVMGKVILRRSVATVVWKNGETSDEPVTDLLPFHPKMEEEFPFSLGAVVRKKKDINMGRTIRYGVVQSFTRRDHSDFVEVKWLATINKDPVYPLMTKLYNSEEDPSAIEIYTELNFQIGLIVISKDKRIPGIVIGHDLMGNVIVDFGSDLECVRPINLEKLNQVAYLTHQASSDNGKQSYSVGISWHPLREHDKICAKHVSTQPWATMADYGNVIPTAKFLHGNPYKVLNSKKFLFCLEAPANHSYLDLSLGLKKEELEAFSTNWEKDLSMLFKTNVERMWIRGFTDHMNLFSVLMKGGMNTPLEFGLFSFDIFLPMDYPKSPPRVCYVNSTLPGVDLGLPADGIICIQKNLLPLEVKYVNTKDVKSNGKGKRNANAKEMIICTPDYTLINVLQAIQKSLFRPGVGTRRLRDSKASGDMTLRPFSQYTIEFTKAVTNQEILRDVIDSITSMMANPPSIWEDIMWSYYQLQVPRILTRVKNWMHGSQLRQLMNPVNGFSKSERPGYALLPFDSTTQVQMRGALERLAEAYSKIY